MEAQVVLKHEYVFQSIKVSGQPQDNKVVGK